MEFYTYEDSVKDDERLESKGDHDLHCEKDYANPAIHLSNEQCEIVHACVDDIRTKRSPYITLAGHAGTGKTTIVKEIVKILRDTHKLKVNIVAPTGKAAQVLSKKGIPATSVHRLIYEVQSLVPLVFRRTDKLSCDVVIVDEASMVNSEMMRDILSFKKMVLFVGDHGQLSPIGNDPGLMKSPDYILTKIFRQAEGSDIIDFATFAREFPDLNLRQKVLISKYTDVVNAKPGALRDIAYLKSFDQIICGRNNTRHMINGILRLNKSYVPVIREKVICLKNDYQHGIVNGEQFIVDSVFDPCEENEYRTEIRLLNSEGSLITVPFWADFFSDNTLTIRDKPRDLVWLDLAYAVTCHKSQGSEWDNILVINESFGPDKQRWTYTAITRAAKKLTWL